jgi:uncharacterized membrane protein
MPLAIMRTVFAIVCLIPVAVTSAADEAAKGPDFMALGNNPDWHLEIFNESRTVIFTLESDVYKYRYPATGPSLYRDELTTIYRVPNDDHSLNIIVKGRECQDSATGKAYETTVIVSLDGVGYTGCGDVLNN